MRLMALVFAAILVVSFLHSTNATAEKIIDEPFFPAEYVSWSKIRSLCLMQDGRVYSAEGYKESSGKNSQYVVIFKVEDEMFAVSLFHGGKFFVTRKNILDGKWTRFDFTIQDDYYAYLGTAQEYYRQRFGEGYKESESCKATRKQVFRVMEGAQ